MKKVLVVSTHADIRERMAEYGKNYNLDLELVYLVEFFGKTEGGVSDQNFYAIDDLRNREAIESAIEKIKRHGAFDFVIHTDEYAVYLAAELREILNVPGLKRTDAVRFRDKVLMKKALEEAVLPVRTPRLYSRAQLENFTGADLPVVVKPRSYASSKGVQVIRTLEQLQQSLALASEDANGFSEFSLTNLEYEEFVEGEILHLDGLICSGNIISFYPSRYIGNCLAFLHGSPLGSIALESSEEIAAWKNYAQSVNDGLKTPDGAFHLEAFLTPKGEKVFIELGIRPGGSLIVPSIKTATGFDLDEAHVLLQMGIIPKVETGGFKPFGWLTFPRDYSEGAPQEKVVKEVRFNKRNELTTLASARVALQGDPVSGSFSYIDGLGSFIFVGKTASQVRTDLDLVLSNYQVVVG